MWTETQTERLVKGKEREREEKKRKREVYLRQTTI